MKHPTAPLSIGLSVALAIGLFTSFLAIRAEPAQSSEPDETLKLFFGHTGEKGEFTFKRNGRYDRAELDKINHFLRDWRRNESTRMDPKLLDLVWSIYRESGSHDYIHIVSAYRSPATNEMLRRRTNGVAKNSQHRLGKAMDWFVTDVPLSKLREIAMKMQGGGVGYYPRSGSPFVHTDTGSVRAWPRMTREQLIALFPNGNTLHVPADGKPLPGYEQALARRNAGGGTALAYLDTESDEADATDRTGTEGSTTGWLKRVFPGDGKSGTDTADSTPEPPQPVESAPPVLVATTEIGDADVRMPRARPAIEAETASGDSGSSTLVASASADTDMMSMLVMPALEESYADPTLLAGRIGIRPMKAQPETPAEDAIATLIVPAAARTGATEKPVELAYAPPAPPSAISDADRAILAAFTAVDRSHVVHDAGPALAAAVTRRATGVEEADVEPGSGVVLAAADLRGYTGDEDALLDLIDDATAPPDPKVAHLAMPEPKKDADLFTRRRRPPRSRTCGANPARRSTVLPRTPPRTPRAIASRASSPSSSPA